MIMSLPTPAIIFWGPDQTQIYNDGYAPIMGSRHPRYFAAPYKACWPDTYPVIYPHMRRVMELGETWSVERAHIPVTRHGFDEEAYFSFTFSPLFDDAGRIAGIFQPVAEVTESVLGDRRAETLRLLMPSGLSSIGALAANVDVIAKNSADMPFCRIWLWDHALQSLCLDCHVGLPLAEDEAARMDAKAARVISSGPVEITARGGGEWQMAYILPLGDGAGAGPLGVIAMGVSAHLRFDARYREFLQLVAQYCGTGLERERARQAEARHRRYLDDLFRQAPAAIAVTQGPEHIFELVNPTYDAMVGYRKFIGRPLREAIPELRDHPLMPILDDVYRSGEPYVGSEVAVRLRRLPRAEPEDTFFNLVYQPLRGERGEVTGILHFCYEVTDMVSARLRAETLTAELRVEQNQKDDFLAMLAHELRNPLAPISAAAHIIRVGNAAPESLRRTGEIVTRQVQHMTGLIDDLLDASRVTRGVVTITREPQNMHDVVVIAVEQVRPLIEIKRHRLVLDMNPSDAIVDGDRKRLVQVVANLLDNAAKYSPGGSEIRLCLAISDQQVVLTVQDHGSGISAELLPRVFDLFVQGVRGADRRDGGLGIGLALVHRLVELHGGSVECVSAGRDLGTQFTVRLPLAQTGRLTDAAADDHAPLTPRHPIEARGQRVLIVDDNVDAAESLAMLLEEAGHLTWVEHDPLLALDRVIEIAPDICLLDVGLPQIDGYELAQRLRRLPQLASARLVAVTGYGQAADRKRAADAGFDHFFVKPVDPQAIVELVSNAGAVA